MVFLKRRSTLLSALRLQIGVEMSDLISREATKIILTMKPYDWSNITERREMLNEIDNLPSIEPERKKGKWEVQPSTGEDRPFIWWKCSECGHVIFSETERDRREFHAFCGRCGADMRGEDEDAR